MATVAELIAQAESRVRGIEDQANLFLNALVNLSNVTFNTGLSAEYDYASVPEVNFPVVAGGDRPSGDIPAPTPLPDVPTPVIPAVQDITLPADDLLVPSNTFSFFEAPYSSILLDPLKAKLLQDLENGSYGIETADEQALIQRARDRETEAALQRVDQVGWHMASRGFPMSADERALHGDRAYQGLQNVVSGLERDIALDRSRRRVENRQFTIREAKELEQILIGFHNSVQERALNVARATQEFAIAIFNTLLGRYRARLDAARISGEVQNLRFQAEELRIRAALEAFRGHVTAYEANLRRLTEEQRIKTDLYRGDIESNRTLVEGLVARNTLQQKVLEATVQQNIQISQLTIENAKAKLLAAIEELKLKFGSQRFGADQFFALLTALVSTINTLAVQTSADA